MISFTSYTWGADKPASKPAAKAAPKAAAKAAPKSAAKAAKAAPKAVSKATPKATKASTPVHKPNARAAPGTLKTGYTRTLEDAQKPTRPPQGKTETLTCRDGTEDRHARMGVVLVGGRIESFAYYSKWKPRTCSIYLRRHRDPYSKWIDKGSLTNVNLERGLFMIEQRPGEYRFVFRDIDRERYCGMEGTINGTLTLRKGAERCEVTGIMEEGAPLGEAYASVEQSPPAAVSASPSEPAPAKQVAQRNRRDDGPWPTPTGWIAD